MNIVLWIGVGLVAGGLASRYLDEPLEDTILDIVIGVVGALFTGFLLYTIGIRESGIDVFQIFTILLSAVIFIWVRNNIKAHSTS